MEFTATPYETMTVNEILHQFSTISRQRISQLCLKFKDNLEVSKKFSEAKRLLKKLKADAKYGMDVDVRRRLSNQFTGIVQRCGNPAYPAYVDCECHFATLEQFLEWAVQQIGHDNPDFEVDKDVLSKGNRIYSEDFCVFLPGTVNAALSNCFQSAGRGRWPIGVTYSKQMDRFIAQRSGRREGPSCKYLGMFSTPEEAFARYKEVKEAQLAGLAEKFKDQIDPRAYAALVNWKVEITD